MLWSSLFRQRFSNVVALPHDDTRENRIISECFNQLKLYTNVHSTHRIFFFRFRENWLRLFEGEANSHSIYKNDEELWWRNYDFDVYKSVLLKKPINKKWFLLRTIQMQNLEEAVISFWFIHLIIWFYSWQQFSLFFWAC